MPQNGSQAARFSKRISEAVASEKPYRIIGNNLSRMTRDAMAEANSLVVENITVNLKKLPKEFNGLRLVHLSDIHHSPFTDLDHISRAVEIANDLKPDMFILTGDYVSHETEYIAPVAEVLGKLESEFGTYACLGNHDHWTDADLVTDLMRGEGINVLVNEGMRFTARGAAFWIAGVDDYMVGKSDLRTALKGSFITEMKLLLAHNPVLLRRAARAGVDLVLSGHTHGGQVKIRDTEKKPFYRRKLSSGLHRRYETQIYITRGIGTVVVPLRYQCPPEISLIELRSDV